MSEVGGARRYAKTEPRISSPNGKAFAYGLCPGSCICNPDDTWGIKSKTINGNLLD